MADTFLSLARKWRPRLLSEVVGQSYVVRALQSAVRQNRLHHALLFTGTRGIGKTTLARIVAMLLNCENRTTDDGEPCLECASCKAITAGKAMDVVELDAASHTGIDDMRELLESAAYVPAQAKYKVFIIDEVHMLSTNAFNGMLKTLEEPPQHVKFVLATTNLNKVPVTIRSRCLCFSLQPFNQRQIGERLREILTAEEITSDDAAIMTIARLANGSLRDALSILDQAIAHSKDTITNADVRHITGDLGWGLLEDTLRAVLERDAKRCRDLSARYAADSVDFDNALARLAAVVYSAALAAAVPNAPLENEEATAIIKEMNARLSPEDLQVLYEIALRGRQQLSLAPDQETGFEMTLLRMMLFVPQAPTDAPPPQQTSPQVPPQQQTPPASSQAAKNRLMPSLSEPAQALFRYCQIEAFHHNGMVLRADKSRAKMIDTFLPALKEDLQNLYGENFTVEVFAGDDDGGEAEYRRDLLRFASEHPFMQSLMREFPTMRIVPESIKKRNGDREHD